MRRMRARARGVYGGYTSFTSSLKDLTRTAFRCHSLETPASVVRTHPACAHAPKGELWRQAVHRYVVHDCTARRDLIDDATLRLLVPRKHVHGEGLRSGPDERDGFVQVAVSNDGQDRAEDLL